MPTCLITGVTGQDGAYLSQLLLQKGYAVIGLMRRSASADMVGERLRWLGIRDQVGCVDGNLADLSSLIRRDAAPVEPDEVYNLGAQSFVAASWHQPLLTGQSHRARRRQHAGGGAHRGARRRASTRPPPRRCSARSRSRGRAERTPFYPRSPYAAAKLYAHWMTVNYRESFGMHASSGILFNHESPLRGIEFVTRKVTDGVARIKLGLAARAAAGQSRGAGATGAMRATMCGPCG